MENDKFIHKNIKDYILYVSDVKNLSKNTSLSYERDLKKFAGFINSLNICLLYTSPSPRDPE